MPQIAPDRRNLFFGFFNKQFQQLRIDELRIRRDDGSGRSAAGMHRLIGLNSAAPLVELPTLVYSEDRYHVLPVSEAIRGHLVPRLGDASNVYGYEVRAVPLQFISVAEMAKILEPYVRENAIVNVDNARSMIFLAGYVGMVSLAQDPVCCYTSAIFWLPFKKV